MQIGTRIPATTTETHYNPPKTSPFLELQSCTDASTFTWGDVTDALLDIHNLKDDWDGMGAEAISRVVVAHCSEVARGLREQNESAPVLVRPTPDGAVCFEWRDESRRIEVEISEDDIDVFEYEGPNR